MILWAAILWRDWFLSVFLLVQSVAELRPCPCAVQFNTLLFGIPTASLFWGSPLITPCAQENHANKRGQSHHWHSGLETGRVQRSSFNRVHSALVRVVHGDCDTGSRIPSHLEDNTSSSLSFFYSLLHCSQYNIVTAFSIFFCWRMLRGHVSLTCSWYVTSHIRSCYTMFAFYFLLFCIKILCITFVKK